MVDDQEDLPVAVLQSIDDPRVALMVTDPGLIEPGYGLNLSAEDQRALELDGLTPMSFCTLSLSPEGLLTANLLGPLVVNPNTGVGKQFVLVDAPYSTRHPVTQVGE